MSSDEHIIKLEEGLIIEELSEIIIHKFEQNHPPKIPLSYQLWTRQKELVYLLFVKN